MTSNTIIPCFRSCLCVSWSLFVDRTSSPDLGPLGTWEHFHGRDFAQTGLPPPISTLSDRGEHFDSWDSLQTELPPPISALSDRGSTFSCRRDFLPRSRCSQIGGVFSQLGFFADGTSPRISALSDRGCVFTVGIF